MQKTVDIVSRIKHLLIEEKFIEQHRLQKGAFTRQRKLTFDRVVATLIHLVKKSLQIVCNLLSNIVKCEEPPSKQAFSQARKKISHTGFQALFEESLKVFYENNNEGLWRGYRVFGVDSSMCRLPDTENAEEYFERWTRDGDKKQPVLGRISEVVELTSRIVVSGRLVSCRQSEHHLAMEQLGEVVNKMKALGQKRMCFVYDRGYRAKELIKEHIDLGVECLIRLPRKFNKLIDEAVERGESDYLIQPWADLPQMRVLVYTLPSGELEVLLTTIIDQISYPAISLFDVYGARWGGLEEMYKLQKIGMELENFAGQTVQTILQEYWANLIAVNLLNTFEIEHDGFMDLEKPAKDRMNKVVVFGSIREDIFKVLIDEMSIEDFRNKFNKLASRHRVKVRPGRAYSREGIKKLKRHHVYRRVC